MSSIIYIFITRAKCAIKNKLRSIQFTLKFTGMPLVSLCTVNFIRVKTMKIPPSLFYSNQHLWTKPTSDGAWEAGITDYAQDLLGDIVFIEPPAVGTVLKAGQPCGLVESVKTGSDLHALVDGEVIAVNEALLNSPEQINDSPYKAWIFKFKANNDTEVEKSLLSATAYQSLTDAL